MKPSKLSKAQIEKIIKVIGYIAVSSAVSAVATYITNHPELFGVYFPIVNIIMVTLKQVFTEDKNAS